MYFLSNINCIIFVYYILLKLFEYQKIIFLLRKRLKALKVDLICTFGIQNTFLTYVAGLGLKSKLVASERRSPHNLSAFWRIMSRYIYRRCDGVVFQLDKVQQYYYNILKKKSIVIPNPVFMNSVNNIHNVEFRIKTISAAAARLEFRSESVPVS